MKVSLLIPCHNEEKLLEKCLLSCFSQTRQADQIIVIDDASTDRTDEILLKYLDQLQIIRLTNNSGNKSYAQEWGLKYITGDIFITVDADSFLDKHFIEKIISSFTDENVIAVSGYIRSLNYNWLTACRALDYTIGQNIHKLAQSYLNFLFVIPGTAGAFRTRFFKKYISFDHDTVTEDLDFTYKLHHQSFKIKYNREAIVYTLDPTDLKSYLNQMRRWYGGGWQNLLKHLKAIHKPTQALQLSLIYIEGLIFSLLIYLIPLISLKFFFYFIVPYLGIICLLSVYAALKEKRINLFLIFPFYLFMIYLNAWVFIEQFLGEVIIRKRKLIWIQPKRVKL